MRWIVLVAIMAILPLSVSADTGDLPQYVQDINYRLEQPFAGKSTIANLSQYIQTIYSFSLGLVGIFAVVLIMFGGLRWIAAAGNESVIGEAKEIITSAIAGLVIALLSYTILAFINPQTTDLSLSVFQIPNTFSDTNIVDLSPCDGPTFHGQVCQVAGTGHKNCEDLTCNEIGYYDNQYCRGMACTDGKCYRGPVDTDTYSCQVTQCGQLSQNCAELNPKDDIAYGSCVCDHYNQLVTDQLNFPAQYSAWTTEQVSLLNSLCIEQTPQDRLVAAIIADLAAPEPHRFGYTGTPGAVDDIGWNCQWAVCRDAQLDGVEYDPGGGTSVSPTTVYSCQVST